MKFRRQTTGVVRESAAEDSNAGPVSGWLTLADPGGSDVTVKPVAYLPTYEELLAPLRGSAFCLLELGVWKGDSLAMWHDAFPEATIIGIDLRPPQMDLGPKVHCVAGDQSDANLLASVRAELAPDGFAVVIDDASHVGQVSARSLQALYVQHLKAGGLYIVEDWGTGYLSSWPDGDELSGSVGTEGLDEAVEGGRAGASRLPSHDFGMVGLVKRLVDHTAAGTLAVHQPERLKETLPIKWMRVQDGMVILKKPGELLASR